MSDKPGVTGSTLRPDEIKAKQSYNKPKVLTSLFASIPQATSNHAARKVQGLLKLPSG